MTRPNPLDAYEHLDGMAAPHPVTVPLSLTREILAALGVATPRLGPLGGALRTYAGLHGHPRRIPHLCLDMAGVQRLMRDLHPTATVAVIDAQGGASVAVTLPSGFRGYASRADGCLPLALVMALLDLRARLEDMHAAQSDAKAAA